MEINEDKQIGETRNTQVMAIRLVKPEDRQQWDAYVMKSSSASCYHLMGWRDVIHKSFGHSTWYLLSEDEKKSINGILPLVHLKSAIFGNYAVSLPYFNYGGVSAEDREIGEQLIQEAIRHIRSANAKHIELRQSYPLENGLPVKTTKVSMWLTLPSKVDELWNSLSSRLRGKIRKPTKEGMYVRFGRVEELESFYAVFAKNMRDLGTPVYSKSFFYNILTEFPDTSWICTIYTKDGLPVASGFLIGHKERLEFPWVSSLKQYGSSYPNSFLYWSVLEFAHERKYKVFDFGRSTPNEGTYRFKEQWGADSVQLYWHYWLENGQALPELNPHNPKYHLAISIWKKLPLSMTKLIGPAIVKKLP